MSYVHIMSSKYDEFTPEFVVCIDDNEEKESMVWWLKSRMESKYGDGRFFYATSKPFTSYHSPNDDEVCNFKKLWENRNNHQITYGDAYVSETTNKVVFSITDVLKTMFHDLIHFKFLNIKWKHER